jgi:hypothetical protein
MRALLLISVIILFSCSGKKSDTTPKLLTLDEIAEMNGGIAGKVPHLVENKLKRYNEEDSGAQPNTKTKKNPRKTG